MSMLDLLDQDVFWIGSDGRRHELVDMHHEHRQNLLSKLRRTAYHAQNNCNAELARRGEPTTDEDPTRWLETRPFVRMLRLSIAFDVARVATGFEDADDFVDAAYVLIRRLASQRDGRRPVQAVRS